MTKGDRVSLRALAFAGIVGLVGLGPIAFARAAGLKSTHEFAIPAQPLDTALLAFSDQAKVQVLMHGGAKADARSAGAVGELVSIDALKAILQGTGYGYKQVDSDTVAIISAESQIKTSEALPSSEGKENEFKLDEVLVTGTHIRGATEVGSHLQIYSTEDIKQSGAGTVAEFISKLPGNFAEVNDATSTAINGGVAGTLSNRTASSGIDLRGLGTQSTLVLVNGRRLAPGNYLGNIVDISMIPIGALDRIEILPDGASAIYGSDAVGGVVNFILRQDFEGSETRARFGSVTKGSRESRELGQTFGHTWSGGSAMLSYEYRNQTPLSAADRSFTRTAQQPFQLLPEEVQHSVYATLDQSINDNLRLFGEGSFGHRTTHNDFFSFGTYNYASDVNNYSGVLGAEQKFSTDTSLELSVSHSTSQTRAPSYYTPGLPTPFSLRTNLTARTGITSVDADLSGSLWTLPAGAIRYAFGGQFRRETLVEHESVGSNNFVTSRNINAEFIEIQVPITRSLDISLADRNEHYSDFGSTNNPKVSLNWRVGGGAALRASYGTSFRAPALNDLNPIANNVGAAALPDPRKTGACDIFDPTNQAGCTPTLFFAGGNPALGPEKAKIWSVGVDWRPEFILGLKVNVDYYNIQYDDRISTAGTISGIADLLLNEGILGPTIIQRNVPSSVIQNIVNAAGASFVNFGVDINALHTLADGRSVNLATQKTNGLDFGVSYRFDRGDYRFEAGLDGTKILKLEDKFANAPAAAILNTTYNPVDLRLRARTTVGWRNVSWSIFGNYTDSYRNTQTTPSSQASSWLTEDTMASYAFEQDRGLLAGLSLAAGVTNLTNRNPPYIENPNFPIYYDAANANPLGRFVFAQLQKRF